jgi:uncharacterized membrane protein YfcA
VFSGGGAVSIPVALLGLAVGFFVGLSGVGAGTLLTPVLLLIGIHPRIAVGTDLAYSALTKLVATARHARSRLIHRRWLGLSALGGVPATLAGSEAVRWLPGAHQAEHALTAAVSAALVLSALAIVVKDLVARGREAPRRDLADRRPGAVVLLGACVGLLVGLTSVGGGSVFLACLLLCSALDGRQAVATDIANSALLTLPAALWHLAAGDVDLRLAANLLVGSVPGVLLGSRLAQHVPGRPLRIGVALALLAGGLKLLT